MILLKRLRNLLVMAAGDMLLLIHLLNLLKILTIE